MDLSEDFLDSSSESVAYVDTAVASSSSPGWTCSCCNALNGSDVEACTSCSLHRPAGTPQWSAAERERVASELDGPVLMTSPITGFPLDIASGESQTSPQSQPEEVQPQPISPRNDSPMALSRELTKRETLSASPESDDLQLASMLHGWQQLEDQEGRMYWRNWNDGQIRWNPPTASPSSDASRSVFESDEEEEEEEERVQQGAAPTAEHIRVPSPSPLREEEEAQPLGAVADGFEFDVDTGSDNGGDFESEQVPEPQLNVNVDGGSELLMARRPTPVDTAEHAPAYESDEFDGSGGLDGSFMDDPSYYDESEAASPRRLQQQDSPEDDLFGALALDGTGGPLALATAAAAVAGYGVVDGNTDEIFSSETSRSPVATPPSIINDDVEDSPMVMMQVGAAEVLDPDVAVLQMKEEDPLGDLMEQSVEGWGWAEVPAEPAGSGVDPAATPTATTTTDGEEEYDDDDANTSSGESDGGDSDGDALRIARRDKVAAAVGGGLDAVGAKAAALLRSLADEADEKEYVAQYDDDDSSVTSSTSTFEEDISSDAGEEEPPAQLRQQAPSPSPSPRRQPKREVTPVGGWGGGGGGMGEVPIVARARRRAAAAKTDSPQITAQQRRRMQKDAEAQATILRTLNRRKHKAASAKISVLKTRWGGGEIDAETDARLTAENEMHTNVVALKRKVQALRLAQKAKRAGAREAQRDAVAEEERERETWRYELESLARRIGATTRQSRSSAQRCTLLAAKLVKKRAAKQRKLGIVRRRKEENRRGVGEADGALARKMAPLKQRLLDLDEELQQSEREMESRKKLKLELVAAFELSVKQVTIHRRRVAKQRMEVEQEVRKDRKARQRAEAQMLVNRSPLRSSGNSPSSSKKLGTGSGYGAIDAALSAASLERLVNVAQAKQDALRGRLLALEGEGEESTDNGGGGAGGESGLEWIEREEVSPVRGTNPRNAIAKLRAAAGAAAHATKQMDDAVVMAQIDALQIEDDEAQVQNRLAVGRAKQTLGRAKQVLAEMLGKLLAAEKIAKTKQALLKSLRSRHNRLLRHPRVKAANAREAHRAALHATMLRAMAEAPEDVMAFLPSRKVDGVSNKKKRLQLMVMGEIVATVLSRVYRGHVIRADLRNQGAAAQLLQGLQRTRAAQNEVRCCFETPSGRIAPAQHTHTRARSPPPLSLSLSLPSLSGQLAEICDPRDSAHAPRQCGAHQAGGGEACCDADAARCPRSPHTARAKEARRGCTRSAVSLPQPRRAQRDPFGDERVLPTAHTTWACRTQRARAAAVCRTRRAASPPRPDRPARRECGAEAEAQEEGGAEGEEGWSCQQKTSCGETSSGEKEEEAVVVTPDKTSIGRGRYCHARHRALGAQEEGTRQAPAYGWWTHPFRA